jgi:predicted CXXCH cytochrome family protein
MTRKYVVFLTFAATLFMAANASAQYAHIVNIKGSDHDLSPNGGGYAVQGGFTEICAFCHIPHPSSSATANRPPLWNHTLSTVSSYGVYSSPTFNTLNITYIQDLGTNNTTPGAAVVSNLCLSCHDGTVGMNTFIVVPTTSETVAQNPSLMSTHSHTSSTAGSPDYIYSGLQVGTSPTTVGLRSDHPINFTYDANLAAQVPSLFVPSAIGSGGYATGIISNGTTLPLFSYTSTGGPANTLQCATCHEVHDPTIKPFLRMSNSHSALCLACHGN